MHIGSKWPCFLIAWLTTILGDHTAIAEWFEPPVAITVEGRVLELTDPVDSVASPTIGDWDGDGRYDLLIGRNDGRLRILRNTGTNQQPHYSAAVWFDELREGGSIPEG